MELRREDGSRLVDHALVARVIEIDKVFLPVRSQRSRINCVPMVLGGDVALASREIQSRDIVGTVAVLELDCPRAGCESEELVAHAYAHDGDLGRLYQLLQVVYRFLAMRRVAWSVGDEDAVKVVGDLVDGVVEWEASHRRATTDQAAKDVLLDTAVNQGNVKVTEG